MPTDLPSDEEVRRSFVELHVRPLLRAAGDLGIPTTEVIVAIIDLDSDPATRHDH